MEEQDNKKQKTGCGKALLIFVGAYALLCLIYVGLSSQTQESIDSVVSAFGVILVIALLVVGFLANRN